MRTYKLLSVLLLVFLGFESQAQELDVNIQLRPRFEFRNGYKNLRDASAEPASFISQRSRLGLTYKEDKLKVQLSLQNVGVWGDKLQGSGIDKNSTGIYEANADYQLSDFLEIKVGRQVLAYDNERIFGEANWAQAARTHDGLLIKMKPSKQQQLDVGFALNSDEESLNKLPYQTKNYKSMQYAWYHTDLKPISFSVLFINTGFEVLQPDGAFKNDYQQTFGGFLKYTRARFGADAALYSQQGKRDSKELDAWYASVNLNYLLATDLSAGLGMEYLSGTSQASTSGTNHSFTPLFGSNHAFNGAMDYFYVGNHLNSVGMKDFYGKLVYSQPKYSLQINPHVYYAGESILNGEKGITMDSYLGTEIDFSVSIKLQESLRIDLGYSQLFGTSSLEQLRGGDSSLSQNWAWLSLTFKPSFKILTR